MSATDKRIDEATIAELRAFMAQAQQTTRGDEIKYLGVDEDGDTGKAYASADDLDRMAVACLKAAAALRGIDLAPATGAVGETVIEEEIDGSLGSRVTVEKYGSGNIGFSSYFLLDGKWCPDMDSGLNLSPAAFDAAARVLGYVRAVALLAPAPSTEPPASGAREGDWREVVETVREALQVLWDLMVMERGRITTARAAIDRLAAMLEGGK